MLVRPLTLSGPWRSAVDGLCVTAHCWAEALSPWEAELGGLASLWSALGWLQGKAQPVCLCVSLCARECASVHMSVCARVSVCACVCMCTFLLQMCVRVRVSVRLCVCICARVCVCVHVLKAGRHFLSPSGSLWLGLW